MIDDINELREFWNYWHIYGPKAQSERAELRNALRAFVDDEPCRLDHHGGCQSHDPNEGMAECRMSVARRLLAD